MTVLYAFASNPKLTWTPEGLATWYGVRTDRVRRTLRDFVAAGIVVEDEHPWRGYRWNEQHDWAVPQAPTIRRLVVERWLSLAHADPPRGRSDADQDVGSSA